MTQHDIPGSLKKTFPRFTSWPYKRQCTHLRAYHMGQADMCEAFECKIQELQAAKLCQQIKDTANG